MSADRLTEIINYLSAMSRDVGELRAEMRTRFDEVNSRFDEVRADIRHLSRKVDVMNQDLLDLSCEPAGFGASHGRP
ncbi:MAG TPA: hypothetical protein VM934_06625 [Pyrinomonadaceae bacterium]|nr:hypothetical protein [Pyrinomonadaceae bacterium]